MEVSLPTMAQLMTLWPFFCTTLPGSSLIRFSSNHGFAKGYNEALKQVIADYYVAEFRCGSTAGWLTPVIELMESNKMIAACQSKLLTWSDKKRFEYAGAAGGWLDKYGIPFAREEFLTKMEEDGGHMTKLNRCSGQSAAPVCVRPSVFHEMKGFDEYFAHQEEIDLCWRMQLAGYLIYLPGISSISCRRGTLPKSNSAKHTWTSKQPDHAFQKTCCFQKNCGGTRQEFLLMLYQPEGFIQRRWRDTLPLQKARALYVCGLYRWWLFHKNKSVFPWTKKKIALQGEESLWAAFCKEKNRFPKLLGKAADFLFEPYFCTTKINVMSNLEWIPAGT